MHWMTINCELELLLQTIFERLTFKHLLSITTTQSQQHKKNNLLPSLFNLNKFVRIKQNLCPGITGAYRYKVSTLANQCLSSSIFFLPVNIWILKKPDPKISRIDVLCLSYARRHTLLLKCNSTNILFEKSCTYTTCQTESKQRISHWHESTRKKRNMTFSAGVKPRSQTAFTNISGSDPPVFGSILLFTSAIRSHPL